MMPSPDPEKVHLTARVPVDAAADVVKDEARKGYDLMFIGLDNSIEDDGGFAPGVTDLAAGFEGPLVVFANKDGEKLQLTTRSRLLVPVNGSPASRRAAEIAFALAHGPAAPRCKFCSSPRRMAAPAPGRARKACSRT